MATNLFEIEKNELVSIDEIDGSTFQTKMENVIASINAGNGINLYIPGSPTGYGITSQLPEITGNQFKISGDGAATQINLSDGANLFRFGSSVTTANRGIVENLRLNVTTASPSADDYAFDWQNSSEIHVRNISINNGACLASFNSASGTMSRNSIRNVRGNLNKGLLATGGRIFLGKAGNVVCHNINLSGSGVSTGSLIKLAPPSGDLDTFDFSYVTLQSWVVATDLDGAPLGIEIDWTNGNVQNGEFTRCVVDHTSEYGVKAFSSSGSNNCTNVRIMNLRNDADEGRNLLFDHQGTGIVRGFKVEGGYWNVADSDVGSGAGPAVEIKSNSTRVIGFRFDNNTILETTNATKPSAIKVDANGAKVRNNVISRSNLTAFASGWTAAIETTAGLTECEITGNDGAEINTGSASAISHATYSASSQDRIIHSNTGPNGPEFEPVPSLASASTTQLGSTASRTVRITGTTAIDNFGSQAAIQSRKTLIFDSACTINQSANITTLDGQNFAVPAGGVVDVVRVESGGWHVLTSRLDGISSAAGRALLAQSGTADRVAKYTGANTIGLERLEVLTNQTYSETPIFGGTADPTGMTGRYERHWKDKSVKYRFYLSFSSAGTANNSVQIPLPSGHPTVAEWDIGSGAIGANKIYGVATAYCCDGNDAATNLSAWRGWFEKTAAGVFQVQGVGTAEDTVLVIAEVEYATSD